MGAVHASELVSVALGLAAVAVWMLIVLAVEILRTLGRHDAVLQDVFADPDHSPTFASTSNFLVTWCASLTGLVLSLVAAFNPAPGARTCEYEAQGCVTSFLNAYSVSRQFSSLVAAAFSLSLIALVLSSGVAMVSAWYMKNAMPTKAKSLLNIDVVVECDQYSVKLGDNKQIPTAVAIPVNGVQNTSWGAVPARPPFLRRGLNHV